MKSPFEYLQTLIKFRERYQTQITAEGFLGKIINSRVKFPVNMLKNELQKSMLQVVDALTPMVKI